MNLDDVLTNYKEKREKLVSTIRTFKIIGINQNKVSDILGKTPSAISDLMTAGKDRYDWSLNRIEDALRKLEAYND